MLQNIAIALVVLLLCSPIIWILSRVAWDVIGSYRAGNLGLAGSLAVRNLFRQKRRAILLGTAIGFGMMVLVILGAWAAGLTDIMLNKVLAMMNGHLEVVVSERTTLRAPMIRDRKRFIEAISNAAPNAKEIRDNLGVWSRVIGNGKKDNMIMVGIPTTPDGFERGFVDYGMSAAEGDLWSLTNDGVCGVFQEKAKKLRVKLGDTLNVRFTRLRGAQEVRSYRVGVIFNDHSFFMNMVLYVGEGDLKRVLGYKPWETPGLQVMLHHSKDAEAVATKLYENLTPKVAVLEGTLAEFPTLKVFPMVALRDEAFSRQSTNWAWSPTPGPGPFTNLWLTETLARETGLFPGRVVTFRYPTKYAGLRDLTFMLGGIVKAGSNLPSRAALWGESDFNRLYHEGIPMDSQATAGEIQSKQHPLSKDLLREWTLLPRTHDFDSQRAKMVDLSSKKWKGQAVDVRTLNETGSMAIKVEQVLNSIALGGVLIMFFIIIIGVINTLRMTVRERTREIGTIRSMGMDRREVRLIFLLETLFLSLFACLGGFSLAMILMGVGGQIPIPAKGFWSVLLNNGHIHFHIRPLAILGYLTIILIITALTAYLPSRRAANIHPAEALRHTSD